MKARSRKLDYYIGVAEPETMDKLLARIRNREPPCPLPVNTQEQYVQEAWNELTIGARRTPEYKDVCRDAENLYKEIADYESRIGCARITALTERILKEGFGIRSEDSVLFDFEQRPFGEPFPTVDRVDTDDDHPPLTHEERILFDEAVEKRRVVNHLIQGGAHAAQHLVTRAQDELGRDSVNRYIEFQRLSDLAYFLVDDRQLDLSKHTAAISSVDTSTTPYTVKASAPNLILLLHEGGKGLLETVSLRGLPGGLLSSTEASYIREDYRNMRGAVLQKADRMSFEPWDLRIGIKLWEHLFGSDITPATVDSWMELVELPPPQFAERIPFELSTALRLE